MASLKCTVNAGSEPIDFLPDLKVVMLIGFFIMYALAILDFTSLGITEIPSYIPLVAVAVLFINRLVALVRSN